MTTKRTWLTALMILFALPLWSQRQDTAFIFRFRPGSDIFYVPYRDNETELQRLMRVLTEQRKALEDGRMYINVSSYGATGNEQKDATQIAYLRNSRVKSELITRHRITERMFVTDKHLSTPYGSEKLRNVVVVTFPATLEKIEQLAGKEPADKVRAYYKEQTAKSAMTPEATPENKTTEQRNTDETAVTASPSPVSTPESAISEGTSANTGKTGEPSFAKIALRANLLRWATLTPDLGIEWRIHRDWSIQVNGTWTSWSWEDKNRRYALWELSPEVRYHIGKEKRGYVGVMYHAGQFNYKLSDTGKQGDLMGGGLTGGYLLKLNGSFALDFSLGIGCTHADYEKYTVTDGVRVRQGKEKKNYWGVNRAGITLVWQLK